MLCGTTPTPLDKYKRPRSDFAKVSLGAEKTVPWEYEVFGLNAVLRAKEEGYYIVAIEQDENAQDYKTVSLEGKQRVAFIVGSEVEGLDGVVLSECDVIAEIPMNGSKESLNVVVAFGVAAYRMLNI
jgi:tRNA G18 (ribose-2'-O)-methylase SpoU